MGTQWESLNPPRMGKGGAEAQGRADEGHFPTPCQQPLGQQPFFNLLFHFPWREIFYFRGVLFMLHSFKCVAFRKSLFSHPELGGHIYHLSLNDHS